MKLMKTVQLALLAVLLSPVVAKAVVIIDVTADAAGWAATTTGANSYTAYDFSKDADYGLDFFEGPLTSAGGGPVAAGNLAAGVVMESITFLPKSIFLFAVGPSEGRGNSLNVIATASTDDLLGVSFGTAVDGFEFTPVSLGTKADEEVRIIATTISGAQTNVELFADQNGNRYGFWADEDDGIVRISIDSSGPFGVPGLMGMGTIYQRVDDSDFVEWTFSTVNDVDIDREPTGGNPDARISVTTRSPTGTGTAHGLSINETLAVTAPLRDFGFSISVQAKSGPGAFGQGQSLAPVVRQGESIYVSNSVATGFPVDWDLTTIVDSFDESAFELISGSGPAQPNFEGGIRTYFGFSAANTNSPEITQFYDNFSFNSDGLFRDVFFIDRFEDIGADGVPVLERTVGGVTVGISTNSGILMEARTYGASDPRAFRGLDNAPNEPANAARVSGSRFVSTNTEQLDDDDFVSVQPVSFTFEPAVKAFGITTIDLLEENELSPFFQVQLRVYDAGGSLIDSQRRENAQGASGLDLDWLIVSDTQNIVRAELLEFGLEGGAGYGLDDLIIAIDRDFDSDGDGLSYANDNCLFVSNAGQRDTDSDGLGNACDADLNNDCIVNATDSGLFKQVFFSADADADFNGDGVVNAIDLGVLKGYFFAAPGPSGLPNGCDGH